MSSYGIDPFLEDQPSNAHGNDESISLKGYRDAFVMPNFIGQPLGSVALALQDAGLHLGSVSVAAQPANPEASTATPVPHPAPVPQPPPASIVVSQNPAPGQKVVAGAGINFEVKQ